MLRRTNFFDLVQERSFESPQKDIHHVPDLILPRFLLKDWSLERFKLWKRKWAAAKMFAVICDRNLEPQIPTALIDVDDFLFCPFQENEFLLRLKRLLRGQPTKPERTRELDLLVGESDTFMQVLRKVDLFAQSKAPVVISGETGVGKELLARAIPLSECQKVEAFYSRQLRGSA
jgi:DNA-binding NtrC family response regulator